MSETEKTPERTTDYGSFDLFALVIYVWRKKIWIFAMVALCVGLAFVYGYISKPSYLSESKLYCKTSSAQSSAGVANLATLAGISLGNSNKTDPSIFFDEILKGDGFSKAILAKKWAYKGDSMTLERIWKMAPDTSRENWQAFYEEEKLRMVRDGILLDKDNKKNIITLTTQFEDPKLARDINLYVIELLNNYVVDVFRSQAKEVRKFVEGRITEVEDELSRSESALASFQETNQNVTAPRVRMEEKRLQRKLMVNQEMYFQLKKQLDLSIIEEYKDQALIDVVVPPKAALLKYKPQRRKLLVYGFLAGWVLGVMAVIGAGMLGFVIREVRKVARENMKAD